MTIRVFSDEDLERLRSFPEINREELIRFFKDAIWLSAIRSKATVAT